MRIIDVQAPTPQGPATLDQQAFLMGLDFHEAALRAAEEVTDPTGAPNSVLCPMIVCYAFAAELYLKSLAPTRAKEHRLDVLYRRVELKIRNEIAARYEARTRRGLNNLEADLVAFGNAFKDWRYVFESNGQQLRVNLLVAFVDAVYEIIRLNRLQWNVRASVDERLRNYHNPTITVKNLGGGTFIKVEDGTPDLKSS